jgi:hypothetical protein
VEVVSFEPMTIAQMFQTTFALYRRHFWHFLGVGAVVYIPVVFLSAGADLLEVSGTAAHLMVAGQLLIMIAAPAICTGALTRSIAELYLDNPLTVAQAYGSLGSQALALAAAGILVAFGIIAGLLIFVLPGIVIAIYCAVTVPCVVLEDLGPIAAMSRSRTLVRYDMAKVLGLGLILLAASFAIGYPVGRVVRLSVAVFLGSGTPLTQFVSSLAAGLAALWFWPIYVIPQILLYFHLRSCEDEGLLPEEMQISS